MSQMDEREIDEQPEPPKPAILLLHRAWRLHHGRYRVERNSVTSRTPAPVAP